MIKFLWLICILDNIGSLLAGSFFTKAYEYEYLPISTSEVTALKEFFVSTRGYYWTRKDNWLSEPNPCAGWLGIKCGLDNTTGRQTVVEIVSFQ